jgi:hypothetical protein
MLVQFMCGPPAACLKTVRTPCCTEAVRALVHCERKGSGGRNRIVHGVSARQRDGVIRRVAGRCCAASSTTIAASTAVIASSAAGQAHAGQRQKCDGQQKRQAGSALPPHERTADEKACVYSYPGGVVP